MDELPAIKTFPPPSIKSVKASVSRSPPKSGRNQEKQTQTLEGSSLPDGYII